jgi:hypothetical protein
VSIAVQELSPEQLGFDLRDETPAEMSLEDEKDVSKVTIITRLMFEVFLQLFFEFWH